MGEIIQSVVHEVADLGLQNGLMFNPAKTQMILFTKRRVFKDHLVQMKGQQLGLSESNKYLGVELHKSLSWSRHIAKRVDSCKRLLYKCKTIIHRRWGLSPDKNRLDIQGHSAT